MRLGNTIVHRCDQIVLLLWDQGFPVRFDEV